LSSPDASLSPQEKAALASLEAAALADDPGLAHRLRGASQIQARTVAPRLAAYVIGRFRYLRRQGRWGLPTVALGFVLMVWGLSSGAALSVVGALLACAGLRLLGELIVQRSASLRSPAGPPSAKD